MPVLPKHSWWAMWSQFYVIKEVKFLACLGNLLQTIRHYSKSITDVSCICVYSAIHQFTYRHQLINFWRLRYEHANRVCTHNVSWAFKSAVLVVVIVHVDGVRPPSLNCHHQQAYCSFTRWHMSMERYGGMISTGKNWFVHQTSVAISPAESSISKAKQKEHGKGDAEYCLQSISFTVMGLHATNLWHGTNGFISPLKGSRAMNFYHP
jgi:hypothetical protein